MFTTAILLAVITAAALALGTHVQHSALRALTVANDGTAPTMSQLVRSPRWLLGTADMGLATVLNLVALSLAPVAIIQPIGALSLVASVLISMATVGMRITRGVVAGVLMTTGAIAVFVTVSAAHAQETVPDTGHVLTLIALLLACAVGSCLVARSGAGHLARVVGAGVTYGAVASGAHVLGTAARTMFSADEAVPASAPGSTADAAGWPVTIALLLAVGAAAATGLWLVQTAYADGPPETVLAGLTVIDPFTAVGIGAFILGEYARIPLSSLVILLVSGAAAFTGIALLSRYVPDRSPRPPGEPPAGAPHVPALPSAQSGTRTFEAWENSQ